MTVQSTDRVAGPFDGNDVADTFPFTYKVFDKDDLVVIHFDENNVETTLVRGSGYSVALNADQDDNPGGSITYQIAAVDTALPTNETLVFYRDLDPTQLTDLTNQGGFFPQTIERMADKVTMIVQEVKEEVGRALRLNISDTTGADVELPTLTDNDGKYLRVNSNADGLELVEGQPAANSVFQEGTTDGTDTLIITDFTAAAKSDILLFIDGVYQGPTHWSYVVSTQTITLNTAAPNGLPYTIVGNERNTSTDIVLGTNVTYQYNVNAATRTVTARLQDSIAPEDFGAVGDGVTSDAAAMAAACNACRDTGKPLVLQAKHYASARVEVHGTFDVYGNGAEVEYLGLGVTLIAGSGTGGSAVPTAWPNDSSFDPSDIMTASLYTLNSAASKDDATIVLTDATGLSAGDYLFIGDVPSSASSPNNYIPKDFEYVRIRSIATNTLTLESHLKYDYTTAAGVAFAPYLPVNCTVSGLKINTDVDAYQYVVRSAYHCTLKDIEFAGISAVGAHTFCERMHYENCAVTGAFAPISSARGTVSCVFDGITWRPRTAASTGESTAFFLEESCYSVIIRGMDAMGGGISVRSLDCFGGQGERYMNVYDSTFDTTNATVGTNGPIHNANALGIDLTYTNCRFVSDAPITPDSGVYPGLTGASLSWHTGSQVGDYVRFQACAFVSSTTGDVFNTASGFQGNVLFDDMCTFDNCTLNPLMKSSPEGTWTPTLVFTGTAGTHTYSQQDGYYKKTGSYVYITGTLILSALDGAAAGSATITGLPFNVTADANYTVANAMMTTALNYAAGYTQVNGVLLASGTSILLFESGDNVNIAQTTVAEFGATTGLYFSMTYKTDT